MRIVFLVYSQLRTLYDFIFACEFIRFQLLLLLSLSTITVFVAVSVAVFMLIGGNNQWNTTLLAVHLPHLWEDQRSRSQGEAQAKYKEDNHSTHSSAIVKENAIILLVLILQLVSVKNEDLGKTTGVKTDDMKIISLKM